MLFATIPPDYIQKINNTSKEMIDEIVNHMENIKELGELDKYLIINIQYKKDQGIGRIPNSDMKERCFREINYIFNITYKLHTAMIRLIQGIP